MTERLRNTLESLAALLRQEGYPDYAADVDRVAERLSHSSDDACDLIGSLEFWGASGSIADIAFCKENVEYFLKQRPNDQTLINLLERDPREFRHSSNRLARLMAALATDFEQMCKPGSPASQFVPVAKQRAETLMSWVES